MNCIFFIDKNGNIFDSVFNENSRSYYLHPDNDYREILGIYNTILIDIVKIYNFKITKAAKNYLDYKILDVTNIEESYYIKDTLWTNINCSNIHYDSKVIKDLDKISSYFKELNLEKLLDFAILQRERRVKLNKLNLDEKLK